MLWILTAFADRYGMPLFITESGLADGSEPDTKRTRYLAGVLQAAAGFSRIALRL